jgi:Kef-type K+ transport system membrane component KefB
LIVIALITQWIGVHTVLGTFVAGILVGESPILTRHIESQLRGLIIALFMPVFFGIAGLGADLTILKNGYLLLLTISLVFIASIGKLAGARHRHNHRKEVLAEDPSIGQLTRR